jgi:hypothetical protein
MSAALHPRHELVHRMAADLRRVNAIESERHALRALMAGPYRWGDVAALVNDALFEARQSAVSETMASS